MGSVKNDKLGASHTVIVRVGCERDVCKVKKPGGETRNAKQSVSEFKIEMKRNPNALSEDCPECGAPLLRVSLGDLLSDNERNWTRRFVDDSSDLGPGRYRCANCFSEWWQLPASVAS